MTPEQDRDALNAQWDAERKKKAEETACDKGIWENKVLVPPEVERERARLASLTPEELEAEKAGMEYVDELIEHAWVMTREDAEATLRPAGNGASF
jgi:hypothetical protein